MAADVSSGPRTAVVVGAGFIGLETAENLHHAGVAVTVVEAATQILTPLDPELAVLVEAELLGHGVEVVTGAAVIEVTDTAVVLADGRVLPADLVVGSIGVRPDTRLAVMAGLAVGAQGGIVVDGSGRTSHPDVYAVGDAVEKSDSVSGGSSLVALANVANRQGRRVADHIAGLDRPAVPSLGTAIVKVFTRTAAMTGWNEARLQAAGRPYRCIHAHPWNHATYYPGAEQMTLKLLFDPFDGTILGAQAVGGSGVDKRIDILATAMSAGLRARLWPTSSWPTPRRSRRRRTPSTCSATCPRTSSRASATWSSPARSPIWSPQVGPCSTSAPPMSSGPAPSRAR